MLKGPIVTARSVHSPTADDGPTGHSQVHEVASAVVRQGVLQRLWENMFKVSTNLHVSRQTAGRTAAPSNSEAIGSGVDAKRVAICPRSKGRVILKMFLTGLGFARVKRKFLEATPARFWRHL